MVAIDVEAPVPEVLPNDTVISSASVLRYPEPPFVMMMPEIEPFV